MFGPCGDFPVRLDPMRGVVWATRILECWCYGCDTRIIAGASARCRVKRTCDHCHSEAFTSLLGEDTDARPRSLKVEPRTVKSIRRSFPISTIAKVARREFEEEARFETSERDAPLLPMNIHDGSSPGPLRPTTSLRDVNLRGAENLNPRAPAHGSAVSSS
jgi:hypothetical protein